MGLFDAIIGAMSAGSGDSNPLVSSLEGIFLQFGGMDGLKKRFEAEGLGDVFSSWVGLEENLPITADQVLKVLGAEQLQSVANKVGLDPAKLPELLATYMPKIIDKLSPAGELPTDIAEIRKGISALLPAILKSFISGGVGF